MQTLLRGHREIEHTADWEVEVWGPDMAALLEEAALGMYAMLGIELADQPRQRRRFELEGDDNEAIIVDFLAELLFLQESERLAFDKVQIIDHQGRLHANLEGAAVRQQAREIKAVTYHRLQVRDTARGLETRIVFDV